MSEFLANVAVVLATVSTVTFLIPQITKLIRTGDSEGVSLTWAVLGFVVNLGWFAYLTSQQLWASIFAPFATFIAYGVTTWAIRRTGKPMNGGRIQGRVGRAGPCCDNCRLRLDDVGSSPRALLRGDAAPSIWAAYRVPQPTGVSQTTWWIGLVEALLWGYYGWFHSDRGILTFMVVGTVGSALMLVRYYMTGASRTGAQPPLTTCSASRPKVGVDRVDRKS